MQAKILYIFVSYFMIIRGIRLQSLEIQKNLILYTVKMTYIVTGSAICLKLRTGFIWFDWNVEFFVKAQLRCRQNFIYIGLLGYD